MSALVEKSSNRLAQTLRHRYESGTSLAYIAVVLVVVGLIAATAVKGIEVFRKSQTNASFVDIQRLAAAYDNFTLRYSAVPGDVGQAAALLPPCAPGGPVPACPSGDGDGTIDRVGTAVNGITLASALSPVQDRETTLFWYHMQASGLLYALIDTSLPTTIVAFGQNLPEAEAGGGYRVRAMNTAAEKGLFVLWQADATADATAAGSQVLRAVDTAYLDEKYDDGDPTTGSVRAIAGAVNTCTGGGAGPYQTGANLQSCALAIKISEPVGSLSVAMAINNACTPASNTRPYNVCPPATPVLVTPGIESEFRVCPVGTWTPWVITTLPVCALPSCGAALLTWTVGADICTANSVAGTAEGSFQNVTDVVAPTTGTASFDCLVGGVWAALPNPGATCSSLPPPPPVTCAGTTHTWTVGTETCTANSVGGTAVGGTQNVTDIVVPEIGAATFTCHTGGFWAPGPNPGATCSSLPPPPASCGGAILWGPACSASVPLTPHGSPRSVSNTAAGFVGNFSGTCDNGSWIGVVEACNPVAPPPPPPPPASCSTTSDLPNQCDMGVVQNTWTNGPGPRSDYTWDCVSGASTVSCYMTSGHWKATFGPTGSCSDWSTVIPLGGECFTPGEVGGAPTSGGDCEEAWCD